MKSRIQKMARGINSMLTTALIMSGMLVWAATTAPAQTTSTTAVPQTTATTTTTTATAQPVLTTPASSTTATAAVPQTTVAIPKVTTTSTTATTQPVLATTASQTTSTTAAAPATTAVPVTTATQDQASTVQPVLLPGGDGAVEVAPGKGGGYTDQQMIAWIETFPKFKENWEQRASQVGPMDCNNPDYSSIPFVLTAISPMDIKKMQNLLAQAAQKLDRKINNNQYGKHGEQLRTIMENMLVNILVLDIELDLNPLDYTYVPKMFWADKLGTAGRTEFFDAGARPVTALDKQMTDKGWSLEFITGVLFHEYFHVTVFDPDIDRKDSEAACLFAQAILSSLLPQPKQVTQAEADESIANQLIAAYIDRNRIYDAWIRALAFSIKDQWTSDYEDALAKLQKLFPYSIPTLETPRAVLLLSTPPKLPKYRACRSHGVAVVPPIPDNSDVAQLLAIAGLDQPGINQPIIKPGIVCSATHVPESGSVVFTIFSPDTPDNTTLNYTVSGLGIDGNDLAGQPASPVVKGKSTATVTAVADGRTEGPETYIFEVPDLGISAKCVIDDTSLSTYSVTPRESTIDEGDDAVYHITAVNPPGINMRELNYEIDGTIDDKDIVGPMKGRVTLDANGVADVKIVTDSDGKTDGLNGQPRDETLTLRLLDQETLGASGTITVKDTSTETCAVTASPKTVNEGGTVAFVVMTTGIPGGTKLHYTLGGPGSTIDEYDIKGNVLDGTVQILPAGAPGTGRGTFTCVMEEDYKTEPGGPEKLVAEVTVSPDLKVKSNPVAINDTSINLCDSSPKQPSANWGVSKAWAQVPQTFSYLKNEPFNANTNWELSVAQRAGFQTVAEWLLNLNNVATPAKTTWPVEFAIDLTGAPPQAEQMVRKAIRRWSVLPGSAIKAYVVKDAKRRGFMLDGINSIFWGANVSAQDLVQGFSTAWQLDDMVGKTQKGQPGPFAKDADIGFNQNGGNEAQMVAALGSALGLRRVDNPNSVMNCGAPKSYLAPQNDDAVGMVTLYPDDLRVIAQIDLAKPGDPANCVLAMKAYDFNVGSFGNNPWGNILNKDVFHLNDACSGGYNAFILANHPENGPSTIEAVNLNNPQQNRTILRQSGLTDKMDPVIGLCSPHGNGLYSFERKGMGSWNNNDGTTIEMFSASEVNQWTYFPPINFLTRMALVEQKYLLMQHENNGDNYSVRIEYEFNNFSSFREGDLAYTYRLSIQELLQKNGIFVDESWYEQTFGWRDDQMQEVGRYPFENVNVVALDDVTVAYVGTRADDNDAIWWKLVENGQNLFKDAKVQPPGWSGWQRIETVGRNNVPIDQNGFEILSVISRGYGEVDLLVKGNTPFDFRPYVVVTPGVITEAKTDPAYPIYHMQFNAGPLADLTAPVNTRFSTRWVIQRIDAGANIKAAKLVQIRQPPL